MLYADEVSPETVRFKDKETGARWTLGGRAVATNRADMDQ